MHFLIKSLTLHVFFGELQEQETDSIRKLLHLPEETERGFPEMNGTALVQAFVMVEEAGIAGEFAQSEIR